MSVRFIGARIGDLPRLRPVAQDAIGLTGRSDVTAEDLFLALSRDPDLTRQLMRFAGASLLGLPGSGFDLREAASSRGFGTLRCLILLVEAQRVFRSPGSRLRDLMIWEQAVAAAATARNLAAEHGLDSDAGFLVALLHDVGKVLLDRSLGSEYSPVLERVFDGGAAFAVAERELLGFDHADVGALVAAHWGLEPPLVNAIGRHHEPASTSGPLVDLLNVASGLTDVLGLCPEREPEAPDIRPEALERFRLTGEGLEWLAATVDSLLRTDAERLSLDLPEICRLDVPGTLRDGIEP